MINVEKLKEMARKADKGLKEVEIIKQIEDEALREHLMDCYREYRKEYGLKMLIELNDALGGEALDVDGSIDEAVEAVLTQTFSPALVKAILKDKEEK